MIKLQHDYMLTTQTKADLTPSAEPWTKCTWFQCQKPLIQKIHCQFCFKISWQPIPINKIPRKHRNWTTQQHKKVKFNTDPSHFHTKQVLLLTPNNNSNNKQNTTTTTHNSIYTHTKTKFWRHECVIQEKSKTLNMKI